MAGLQGVLTASVVLSVAGTCFADAQVTCVDDGITSYAYHVNGAGPLTSFFVGTSDLDISNYTNVRSPYGWEFGILSEGMSHSHGHFTDHGQVSIGPCRCLTAGRVGWWADDDQYAIRSFTFGFDSNMLPKDVGWYIPSVPLWADWNVPVGMGAGPVHGPTSWSHLPGDFDGDYDVDGADFLYWQLNDGSKSDLDLWQAAYGTTASPNTAASTRVPEPTTGLLLMLAMAAMLTGGRTLVSKLNCA